MARPIKTVDDLHRWLVAREGIAHRDDILRAGFAVGVLRGLVRDGGARMLRRAWAALPEASADLVTAARAGGRVTCVSLARRRRWWMPESVGDELHLQLAPSAGAARLGAEWNGVLHWTKPVATPAGRVLVAPVLDALAHIAVCQPRDVALVLWESAARTERLAPEALRAVQWRTRAARELAESVTGLSDSGLETILVAPLRRWGLRVRQQVWLAGHPVDVLVGDRLVVQTDGYEFHSTSAQRTRDVAHDAELRLRGYTVLRFTYAQLVHDWPAVERTILRAVAEGLHLAA
ncbi:endonuclease domain-containing protein [Microbacterium sp.]|uniref:endonuclease domain-containing protein n=1 Tax=Microbacterium sp. TaxID=51671 RepID=UPI0039E5E9F6